MASVGPKFPQSATTAAEDPWLDDDWVTPTGITADAGNTANITSNTFDTPDQSYVLKAYNFDFSAIPNGSTINGVVCTINAYYATAAVSIDLMQILNTSLAKVGTNMASTPTALTTTTSAEHSWGGATDNWGNSLTTTWVKNSNFGVAIGALAGGQNGDVHIDWVNLTVYYTAPNTNSSAGSGSLTVTGKEPTVSILVNKPVSAGVGALTITGQAPTVRGGNRPVLAAAGALSITGLAPEVSVSASSDRMRVSWLALKLPESASSTVSTQTGSLALTGYAPTILGGSKTSSAGVGSLSLTGYAPTVNGGARTASAGFGSLTLAGLAPTLTKQLKVSAGVGSLTLTGQAPTVKKGILASAGAGVLTLTGQAPTVVKQLRAVTGVGSIVINGYAPSPQVVSPGQSLAGLGALTISGLAPTVRKQLRSVAGVGSLTITGQAPTVRKDLLAYTGAGALTIAGYAPTAEKLLAVYPGAAQIIITGYEPTVLGGEASAVVTTGPQPAGRPSRSRRRRKPVLVEIDGQEFIVRSEAEAAELIDRAEEAARQVAEDQAKEILAKRTKKARKAPLNTSPLRLNEPVITVRPLNDGTIDPEWLRTVQAEADRISEAFRAVAQQYETAILLNHRLQLDEEDALVALLLTI